MLVALSFFAGVLVGSLGIHLAKELLWFFGQLTK